MDVDPMKRDEREDKLPAWAQSIIRNLRGTVRNTLDRNTELEARVVTLEGLARQEQNAHAYSDTVLVLDDTEDSLEVPLGDGRTIEFADFYTVRYGDQRQTGGARVLVVQTREDMQIRPTFDPHEIIITRA